MPLIQYEDWNPRGEAYALVTHARQIAANYAAQGYDLTLRQLYYQFVSRDIIPNNQKSYDKLGQIVNRARLAGLLDWDYIVDRTRNLQAINHYDDPAEIIDITSRAFRLDKWADQPTRVEVWVEKEALAGVIQRAAGAIDCAWFSCRGYVSQSEMWGAAQRLRSYIEKGQNVVIIHLGDHDPSGIDMTRDIRERLMKFIAVDLNDGDHDDFLEKDRSGSTGWWFGQEDEFLDSYAVDHDMSYDDGSIRSPLEIERIALNFNQVQQYNPPPNPAKITDSRADKYIARFGRESWELDALEPAVLNALIQNTITSHLDTDKYDAQVAIEDEARAQLRQISAEYENIVANLPPRIAQPEGETE